MEDEIFVSEQEIIRSFWSHSTTRAFLCGPSESGNEFSSRHAAPCFSLHFGSVLFCSGKSHLIRRILHLEKDVFGSEFDSISVFSTCASSQYYSLAATNSRIKIEQGTSPGEAFERLADEDRTDHKKQLWLLEDFFTSRNVSDPRLIELFTAGSHHLNLSLIATGQTLFGSRDLRTITLQCTLLVLWPSVRDSANLSVLSRQIFPDAPSAFLSSALHQANLNNTSNYKRPIYVNVSPSYFSERLRVASGALPDDGDLTFYLPTRKNRHR